MGYPAVHFSTKSTAYLVELKASPCPQIHTFQNSSDPIHKQHVTPPLLGSALNTMLQKMSTKRWNTFGKICTRNRHKRKWVNKKQEEKNKKWRRQKIRNHLQY
jgi:hypothetical protein